MYKPNDTDIQYILDNYMLKTSNEISKIIGC